MIWIITGIASLFWDPGMGEVFPLLPIATLGFFWKRINPLAIAVLFYLHHALSLNTGLTELLLLILLFLFTEIDKQFLTPTIPFIILSAFVTALTFFEYGTLACGIVGAIAIVIFLWRVLS